MNYSDREPQYQDDVKHKNNDATGVVIAKFYTIGIPCLDVRLNDEHVMYNTPAANWEVVRTEEDRHE